MHVQLIYGTTEGQTQKIAQFVADRLKHKEHRVSIYGHTGGDPFEYAQARMVTVA